ncbi:FAD-dependent oxidoreductase [Sanguibacter sp. A247]|uniref:FAD-dependent oxidoreductase n=1 Tax=unclassified Sanguibacter TaxID=2645534 RepID=UPI003FD87F47
MTPADAATHPAPLPAEASVLIVGAGLAGLRTAALLREHGHTGPVHLVGAEPHGPYDRPPLSKHLLDDAMRVDLGADLGIDLDAIGVEVRLGTRVTRIDSAAASGGSPYRATLTDATLAGEPGSPPAPISGEIVVDAVVLATGSGALRVPGWEHALTLHTLADAERLRTALGAHERPRLVCIGAGWVGSEVAGVAAAAGAQVTVVERAAQPLEGALGAVGAHTRAWFEDAGVVLLTGAGVGSVEPDGVVLEDGTRVPADVILASVGARPAPLPPGDVTAQLVRAGDGSVLVDSAMRPYCAGDVAASGPASAAGDLAGGAGRAAGRHPWLRVVGDAALRESARHGTVAGGHWDAALTGPEAAVRSLLDPGSTNPLDPAPYVFSTMLGHEVAMYGAPRAQDEVVLRGDPASADGWVALWFAADEQRAADASGRAGDAADGPGDDALRTLTAVFVVDRPRDVAAARRLFRGADLPRLAPATASDPTLPLRAR